MKTTHFETEELYETAYASPCGAYSHRHDYSPRVEDVTCRKCLTALGYTVKED